MTLAALAIVAAHSGTRSGVSKTCQQTEAALPTALSFRLAHAARLLRCGGVVAHATEGVWGLACDPFDQDAVAQVLSLKKRSWKQGLIVIGAAPSVFAEELARLPAAVAQEISDSWPGANTWLVPNHRFPPWITGRHATVAVRVPGHGQARALCAAAGGLLVSTSANRSGRPAALNALQLRLRLGNGVPMLPGAVNSPGQPSRIRAALTGERVR